MRLWHKDLITVLPRMQLCGQWRECCAIAKSIAEKGTPGHILVNKIMDYPDSHFIYYAKIVSSEMQRRGYTCNMNKFTKHVQAKVLFPSNDELFDGWHNERYLRQCLYNLQEKHDCGAIPDDEWQRITDKYVGFKDAKPW